MKRQYRTFCPTDNTELTEIYMKKLHSLAFYALVAPAISLGSTAALAQPSGVDGEHGQQSSQRDQGAKQSTPGSAQGAASSSRAGHPGSQTGADRRHKGDSNKQRTGYMGSAPANGMQADNLIGAKVQTTDGENVGPVRDLIIDEDGRVVALVVGIGGFLGLGERDVAIGWDDVTRSGSSDDLELRISATRDELSSATEFKTRD